MNPSTNIWGLLSYELSWEALDILRPLDLSDRFNHVTIPYYKIYVWSLHILLKTMYDILKSLLKMISVNLCYIPPFVVVVIVL